MVRVYNRPDNPWYKRLLHRRIPRLAESRLHLDTDYTLAGGTPIDGGGETAPVYIGGWTARNFTVGVPFTIELATMFSGNVTSYGTSGLPAWATLTGSQIAGTPTVSGTTSGITASATNGAGTATTPAAGWVVALTAPIYIGGWSARDFTIDVPFTIDLSPLFSGTGLSYSANGLPAWASLVSGQITGTPTATGTTAGITASATNNGGAVTTPSATWTVEHQPPEYAGGWLPHTYTVGVPVTIDLAPLFSGTIVSYGASGLPAWAAVAGNQITGTPTVEGTISGIFATATNTGGSANTPAATWTILPVPVAAPTYAGGWAARNFTVGVPFAVDVAPFFSGSVVSYSASGLPSWATLAGSQIAGTPTVSGSTAGITVTATNSAGSIATPSATWTAALPTSWVMTVGNLGTADGYKEATYGAVVGSDVVADTGYTLYTLIGASPNIVRYRVNDALGADVQLPGVTALQVTLTDSALASTTVVLTWDQANLRYDNTNATAAYNFIHARVGQNLTVTGLNTNYTVVALTISGTMPSSLIVGQTYDGITAVAAGGTLPYTYSLQGTWPAGMTINSSTGVISGTPTTPGTYAGLFVRVTDGAAATANLATFTITVTPAVALGISGTPVLTATEDTAYAGFDVTASGGASPYTYALTGTWPTGITVNSSGQVRGTPTQSGTFTGLSVRVTDALAATASLTTFTLTVTAASAYIPTWVESTNGYLTYPGTVDVGGDSDTLEIVWRLKNMDALPASRTEIYAIPGARVNLYFLSTGRLNCNLTGNSGVLFTWQSTNNAAGLVGRVAGDWEFRMQASLVAGTPTVTFTRRPFTDNIAGAWQTITGAATVGPIAGAIDGARAGQGVHAILASITGTNIATPVHFAHFWYKSGVLQAPDAFGAAGQLEIDPALVDTPDLLIKAANVTDDLATTKVWTVNGTLGPIGGSMGSLVGYAVGSDANPIIPAHIAGDVIITVGYRTTTHGGVAPSVTIDAANPWVKWGELLGGTDRAITVYRMVATGSGHTATWANANGSRPVWVYRGKVHDVLELAHYPNDTSFIYPEL